MSNFITYQVTCCFCSLLDSRLEAVFIASVADFLAVSTSFFPYLLLILLAKDINPYPFTYILSLGSNEYLIFIQWSCTQHYLITIVRIILSSISNGLLFWLVNHTMISSYFQLNVFKKIWLEGKLPKDLFGKKVYSTHESCW